MNIQSTEAAAGSILEKHNIERPPVDVSAIASALGIVVKIGEMGENISGALYREHGKAVVGINKNEGPQRQRFTLAHEIGHFVLHRDQDFHVDSESVLFRNAETPEDVRERAANAFAAALLMPKTFLEGERSASLKNVKKLADKYNVSAQAMSYRLVNLGLMPMF